MSDKFDAMMLILNRLNRQEEVTVQSLMDGSSAMPLPQQTLRRSSKHLLRSGGR